MLINPDTDFNKTFNTWIGKIGVIKRNLPKGINVIDHMRLLRRIGQVWLKGVTSGYGKPLGTPFYFDLTFNKK